MAHTLLKPNERYALVGKTRSGKTALAMVLAGTFARTLSAPWQVWWFDTKNDPDDLRALRSWGFRNASNANDKEAGGLMNALYYIIRERPGGPSTVDQVQALCAEAYNRGNVIIVIDEYTQVVVSIKNPGSALLDCFTRGGGKKVGVIGLTQEPVYVPRQLISQATHVCLLSLTYQADIKYVRNLCPVYEPPIKVGDPYGFYWSWVDGHAEWSYYENQAVWFETLQAAKPLTLPEGVPVK